MRCGPAFKDSSHLKACFPVGAYLYFPKLMFTQVYSPSRLFPPTGLFNPNPRSIFPQVYVTLTLALVVVMVVRNMYLGENRRGGT